MPNTSSKGRKKEGETCCPYRCFSRASPHQRQNTSTKRILHNVVFQWPGFAPNKAQTGERPLSPHAAEDRGEEGFGVKRRMAELRSSGYTDVTAPHQPCSVDPGAEARVLTQEAQPALRRTQAAQGCGCLRSCALHRACSPSPRCCCCSQWVWQRCSPALRSPSSSLSEPLCAASPGSRACH